MSKTADTAAGELAYKAGRRAHQIQWPEGTPPEQSAKGTHHCPFPADDPQRVLWLRGYADYIDEQAVPPSLLAEIRDEIGMADHAA